FYVLLDFILPYVLGFLVSFAGSRLIGDAFAPKSSLVGSGLVMLIFGFVTGSSAILLVRVLSLRKKMQTKGKARKQRAHSLWRSVVSAPFMVRRKWREQLIADRNERKKEIAAFVEEEERKRVHDLYLQSASLVSGLVGSLGIGAVVGVFQGPSLGLGS